MRLAHLLSIALLVATSSMYVASAQTFPNRPIRVITSEAGGLNDQAARFYAPGLSAAVGQPVIVENISGATGRMNAIVKGEPDGHTLLSLNATVWLGPLVRKVPPWNTADFTPVTIMVKEPHVHVVTAFLPVKSVKDLIALAKAKPGELNQSMGSLGGAAHLGFELFRTMTGTKIQIITYKSDAQELIELTKGAVHSSFQGPGLAMNHVKTGRLRAIAVTSLERSPLYPGVPAIAETVPGYEYLPVRVVYVKTGTPPAIIAQLNREIVRVVTNPDIKQKVFETGGEVWGSTPEQAAQFMKSDIAKWTRVIKEAGIELE